MQDILQDCVLFQEWTDEDLKHLKNLTQEKSLNVGEILFSEGAQADSLYIVKNGSIKIEKASRDDEEQVAQFARGSYFGEMGMLGTDSSIARSASAIASEATNVLQLPYAGLNRLLDSHPELGARFYKTLAVSLSIRIRKTTQDLAGLKSLRLRHV